MREASEEERRSLYIFGIFLSGSREEGGVYLGVLSCYGLIEYFSSVSYFRKRKVRGLTAGIVPYSHYARQVSFRSEYFHHYHEGSSSMEKIFCSSPLPRYPEIYSRSELVDILVCYEYCRDLFYR